MTWALGKVPWKTIAELIPPVGDRSVLQGPGLGLDAAAIRLGDGILVTATDPVTFATDRLGWYAVWVNGNDVAASGARPRWFQAVVLLPEGSGRDMAGDIMQGIQGALESLGADLVGGHTEVTSGLARPIVVGQMMGEALGGRVLSAAGAHPGDLVLFAGHVALEATALLALEMGEELVQAGLSEEELDRAQRLLEKPGIGIVSAALAAAHTGKVSAMHDVTEGGLAQACLEMADASNVALEIRGESLPLLDVTSRVCDVLGIDPLGAIGSGGLLLTCPQEHALEVRWAVRLNGSRCEVVGRVSEGHGVSLSRGHDVMAMPRFDRDEVARLFSERGAVT